MIDTLPWSVRPTIVVVDMHQSELQFECDRDCVPAMLALLDYARKHNCAVVFVEMGSHECPSDPTLPEFTDMLKGYSLQATVWKEGADGSEHVRRACRLNGFNDRHFIVGGLYAGCCVCDTAQGLGESGALVAVFRAACNQDEPDVWPLYKQLRNVTLV